MSSRLRVVPRKVTALAMLAALLLLLASMIMAPAAQARYLTGGRAHAAAQAYLFRLVTHVEASTLGSTTVTVVDRDHIGRCRRVAASALDCPIAFRRTRFHFTSDGGITSDTCSGTVAVRLAGHKQRLVRTTRKGQNRCSEPTVTD